MYLGNRARVSLEIRVYLRNANGGSRVTCTVERVANKKTKKTITKTYPPDSSEKRANRTYVDSRCDERRARYSAFYRRRGVRENRTDASRTQPPRTLPADSKRL